MISKLPMSVYQSENITRDKKIAVDNNELEEDIKKIVNKNLKKLKVLYKYGKLEL